MPGKITFFGPTNQYYILKRLIRYGQSLTSAEFKVLLYIYDRTFPFKKDIESIPYRHFIDGVTSSDSTRWTFPVGLKETALKRAIKGLVEKQVIYRARTDNPWLGTCYWINVEWEAPGIERVNPPELLVPSPEEIVTRSWKVK